MKIDNQNKGRDLNQPCLSALRDALNGGDTVYIIGKGPSLDELTKEDFIEYSNAPVLCVNESVHAIERLDIANPLFCIQYDRLNNISNKPQRATWFLSDYAWIAQNGEKSGAVKFDIKE